MDGFHGNGIPHPQAAVVVIIPCYRQAHFLAQAIESALAQTRPVQVIVVDDGSPDDTAEVAARYPQVFCIRQENQGLARARNSGFRAAGGDYVMFLDADDRLTPGAVEAHLRCFVENPGVGFVVGDIDHIAADSSYVDSPRWPVLRSNFYEELLKVNHVANTIAVMFRREVIEKLGGFDPSCSPAEDYRLLLRVARFFPSAHHRTVVAQYRRHQASLSRRGVVMLRAMDRIMRLEWPEVQGNPRLEIARREGVRYWRDHFGRIGLRELYERLIRGDLIGAVRTLAGLLWYVRGRLLTIPWKYRRQALLVVRRRFRTNLSRSDWKESSPWVDK